MATRELQVTTSAGRCWHRGDHLHKAHAYNHLDLDAIVQDIDAEVSRLEKVRALLTGHTAPLKRGMPPKKQYDERRGTGTDRGGSEEEMG